MVIVGGVHEASHFTFRRLSSRRLPVLASKARFTSKVHRKTRLFSYPDPTARTQDRKAKASWMNVGVLFHALFRVCSLTPFRPRFSFRAGLCTLVKRRYPQVYTTACRRRSKPFRTPRKMLSNVFKSWRLGTGNKKNPFFLLLEESDFKLVNGCGFCAFC